MFGHEERLEAEILSLARDGAGVTGQFGQERQHADFHWTRSLLLIPG
jgi:hypothetical protein